MENIDIAPLLLIPFVENAVKYNATGNKQAYVYLSFRFQNGEFYFTCENPVDIHTNGRKSKGGLGLSNIKRRLDLLFKNCYSLELIKTEHDYTVHLHIKQ